MTDSSQIPLANMKLYTELKEALIELIPPDVVQSRILRYRYRFKLKKRRIIEKISTLSELIQEMEDQVIIDPQNGDIDTIIRVARDVQYVRPEIKEKIEAYEANVRRPNVQRTVELNGYTSAPSTSTSVAHAPPPPTTSSKFTSTTRTGLGHLPLTSQPMKIPPRGSSQTRGLSTPTSAGTPTTPTWSSLAPSTQYSPFTSPSKSSSSKRLKEVPDHVIDLMATTFDTVGGCDWQTFVQGLGRNLSDYDKIRVLQGETERAERDFVCLRKRLRHILQRFQEKCRMAGVFTDIIEIIVDTLKSTKVWGEPVYNRLAREVQQATGFNTPHA